MRYEDIAKETGLTDQTAKRFVDYMRARWGDPEDERTKCRYGYAGEWALRFQSGDEFNCSDSEGQRILKTLELKERKRL